MKNLGFGKGEGKLYFKTRKTVKEIPVSSAPWSCESTLISTPAGQIVANKLVIESSVRNLKYVDTSGFETQTSLNGRIC